MKAKTAKFTFIGLAVTLTLVMFLWPAREESRLKLSTSMDDSARDMATSDESGNGGTSTMMESPRFTGEDEKGRRWQVEAARAVQKMQTGAEAMVLEELLGSFTLANGKEYKFEAGQGTLDNANQQMALKGDVRLQAMGFTVRSQNVVGHMDTLDVHSEEKVFFTTPNGYLQADRFKLNVNSQRMILEGHVQLRYNPQSTGGE